jgi:ParB-like chromosome segregation protein Spo0J
MSDDLDAAPLPVHPLADLFPMLPDDELAELAEDIKENGLIHPIVLTNDGEQIVDGRNRLAACRLAGVEPQFERLNGQDPAAYITASNINRRHLTKGQQAMLRAMLYPEPKPGERTDLLIDSTGANVPFDKALLSRARLVLKYGRDDLARAVVAGVEPLTEAFAKAKARRDAADSEVSNLAELQREAPDLASLVTEEQLKLPEAWAAYEKRKADAAASEANRRETVLRITESAYRNITAWASDGFADDVIALLDDAKFRRQLIERLRLDGDPKDISTGAAALRRLIGRIST